MQPPPRRGRSAKVRTVEYFTIKNFRPIEAKEDATDQDRSVLRLCEGLVPAPQGALVTGPQWKPLWGLIDMPARATALLAEADQTKAHFLRISKGARVLLLVWSVPLSRALGVFEVVPSAVIDFDSTDGVSVTAPAGAEWRDKDPNAMWYLSIAAGHRLLGNGIDANLDWFGGALSVLGPAAEPVDPYDLARERIPPCTTFRMNSEGNMFAAGNRDQPMRVWITERPNAAFPFFGGVVSLSTSFVDVRSAGGAAKITALSVFQSYVTVHTDGAPVNVYGVGGTADGSKCVQASSAANASAPNPACAGDPVGDMAFYLGSDLEVYVDQAIRAGPPEKRGARDQEILTGQAAGVWNRDMDRGASGQFCLYDRTTRLFWIFAKSVLASRVMVWLCNERTRTCAGPIHYPDAVAGTVLDGPEMPLPKRL